MSKIGLRKVLVWGGLSMLGLFLATGAGLLLYINSINNVIDERIEQLHNARSSTFYALYPALRVGQTYSRKDLRTLLEDQGYEEKKTADDMLPGTFAWEGKSSPPRLIVFRPEFTGAGRALEPLKVTLTLGEVETGLQINEILPDGGTPVGQFDSLPKQIGAFLAGRLRTQNAVALSDMPVNMRLAVMAIEDAKFLEHHGVSIRGTFRALFKNIQAGRASQGGSTITQQLMKNLFFSSKKEISRKLKEAVFAFVTEMRHSKEAILEAYLNEVYLGQWSTHEIHGVAEAARYYFNKPVSEISLAQSATLAAIIQAPNSHDPRRFADRALKRRNLVLKKMLDAEFILPPEYEMAVAEPLTVVPSERSLDNVDYFIDLVMDRLTPAIKKRLDSEMLTIYVSLNPYLQAAGSRALSSTIDRLQKTVPAIRDRAKKGMTLQGALIAVNPVDCSVVALQGGTNYKQTQFNRVLQGHRQPGSLFKPFVALTALIKGSDQGPIHPQSMFEDSPFEWKYDKQIWKPKNYDGKFRGMVSLRQTLEESLNIPTARLTQLVGVPPIVDTLRKAGITSPLPSVPSIALGSAEVTPFEAAEAFTTLANLGKYCTLRPYFQVFDENKNLIDENKLNQEERLPAPQTFQTVHMLKGTFTHGTARSAAWSGMNFSNFAGKTGTTNEAKDAWFAGFSPELLALVWIGYDEEANVGLTGSSAALPVWLDFMKQARPFAGTNDFVAPSLLLKCQVDRPNLSPDPAAPPTKEVEYFYPGTEPPGTECEKPNPPEPQFPLENGQ